MESVHTGRILIIDDDREVRRLLKKTFRGEHYHFQEAATASEGISLAIRSEPDVVLLDPDGEDVLRKIRIANRSVPIIVMSAHAHERDKIRALDAGADDFVSKPLAIGELLARIRVFLRKRAPDLIDGVSVFRAGDIEVDSAKRRVLLGGKEVHLTRTEYRLMQVLIRHADEVLTHRQLLSEVWGPANDDQPHYIRVYMAQLRRKLEADPSKPRFLRTVPGAGYRLTTRQELK